MKYRSKLFSTRDPYDTEGTQELFINAVQENCRFQYRGCPEYRRILDGMGFSPDDLTDDEALARLPFLPTLVFKRHKLFSLPKSRMAVRATSSGTSGTSSEIGFTVGDLWSGLKMVLKVSKLRRLVSVVPCHYIVFGYKPHKSNKTAVTKTALGATLFTPALSRTFALTYKDGKYSPDLEGVMNAVVRRSKSRFPVRFMGFPSHTYFLMKLMDEKGIRVTLPKGSKIMLGGGWKQFYAEQVDKSVFYELAERVLGVSDDNIVEFFGAVEHPILYCDCKNHRFHVPAYSRVIIRDPETMQPMPLGSEGLVNLITPMVTASPIVSVMTDDIGILSDGKQCGCGLTSPTLEILGRIGMRDIKTCAAGAAEILKEAKL